MLHEPRDRDSNSLEMLDPDPNSMNMDSKPSFFVAQVPTKIHAWPGKLDNVKIGKNPGILHCKGLDLNFATGTVIACIGFRFWL
jgi:hypothetical protein